MGNFKKSQITIFILLGISLLVIVSLSIYFSRSTSIISEDQSFRRTPNTVRDYFEICLEEVSLIALSNLGYQGGYIELPSYMRADSDSFLSFDTRNFFGIPAWYYKGIYRIPTISDMELEVASVVKENLNVCLDDFSGFRESYDVVVKSPMEVDVTISEDSVFVNVDYSIDVSSTDSTQIEQFDQFHHRHNLKLGKMYELARWIVHSEVENHNFENAVIDLISAHPEIPITHMSFSARPKTWYVQDTIREIESLIFYNLQAVRFKGTDHLLFQADFNDYEVFRGLTVLDYRQGRIPPNRPDDAYEYFNLFFDPSDLPDDFSHDSSMSFEDIKSTVKYYPGNLNVVVNPSSGGIMRSSMTRIPGTPIPFPIQMAHFTYDINFMLEINLYDDNAFNGRGYMFRFAFPVSIKSNAPDKDSQGFTISPAPVQYDNPCEDLEGTYLISVYGTEGSQSDLVLRDVELSYDCIAFGCNLGKTTAEGGTFRLTTGLPASCSGGLINAHRDGYLPAQVQHLGEDEIRIDLKKVEDFIVNFDIRDKNNLEVSRPLNDRMTLILRLTPESYGDEQVLLFESDSDIQTVELLIDDAKYFVDILLLESVEDEEWIIGGYKGIFEYYAEETVMANSITFSVPEYNPIQIPFTPERQFEVMEYIENGDYLEILSPRFG